MDDALIKDREATYAILNYLRAGYQGKFTFCTLLSQLQHEGFKSEELTLVQQAQNKISGWIAQLFAGECLLSAAWKEAQTFEAQDALKLLENLKPDLRMLASETDRILALPERPLDSDVKLLLAALVRMNYSRDSYLRGFVEYEGKFGTPQTQQQYDSLLSQSSDFISTAQELGRTYRESGFQVANLPPEYLATLFGLCNTMPVIFRTQLHDVNQLLAPFKGGLSFSAAEFGKEEADAWSVAGFSPTHAGYWRAYKIPPADAKTWLLFKFNDPALVVLWNNTGFTPEQASLWFRAGFPPDYAMRWHLAGYTPEQAKQSIEGGIPEPPPPPK